VIPSRRCRGVFFSFVMMAGALACPVLAQPPDSASTGARPFVPGGYDDKPYLEGFFGRIRLGGYVEGGGTWERADGVTEDLGFELTRMNLLTSTDLRGRVQVWGEVEFEDGGEEIVLELAQVDLLLHRVVNLRGGILLLPLGRFNLAHDGPRNELPRRPPLATDLLGSALSQPGGGLFGRLERASHRVTYEAYAVTGYDDGILLGSADGTRLPAGRFNREDSNASPAWVGRLEWSPNRSHAVGVSGYVGAYNLHKLDGLVVDERRDARIAVGDLDTRWLGIRLLAEGALVDVEIPATLEGLFASRQAGAFVELSRGFGLDWVRALPGSWFTAVARADLVDFDRDLRGDSMRSLTVGVNLRPIPESCFKLAFTRGETRDRFNNLSSNAALVLGLTTYF
jgi:hypothetical protein